ncbi:RHS repeat-associated core domain-containing protein [Corallococcus sicarius]|uniref:RHS repeat-associated core domain-containing protein n=1 Tax=Corallococcus sicarius TaxID=2316726 RepID=A0A3A8MUU7_9BACT|nr:RHS repeat-associated core domain-containing protein [Corallococcus sicarius]RKH35806.1 hypothetical protein D7X12_33630 [Corallococcus sicarius]
MTLAYTAEDQPWRVEETRGGQTLANVYTYDARRLLTRQERGAEAVDYTYRPSGQRLTVTSPAGMVTYGYDALERLGTATGPAGTTEFEWEAGGGRLLAVKGGGLVERRCYEGRGRLRAVLNASTDADCATLALATGLKSLFEYTYDARGNRTAEDSRDETAGALKRTEYGYDGADRLTGVKYEDGRAVLCHLAADGTRLGEKETAAGYAGALTPDAFDTATAQRHWRYAFDSRGGLEGLFNELEVDPTKQRLATYATDLVGRVTSEQRAGGRKDYGWDAGGRLTKVTVVPGVAGEGGSVTTQYRYGWDGLRVARTTGAQTSTYLWAGGVLAEERLAGQPALLYTQGAGMMVAVGAERIAHDGMGSAVGHYPATGAGTRQEYDAWGAHRNGTAPTSAQASLGYTGHAYDAESGLTYAQQRWLDTGTGRFLSEDPMGAGAYLARPTGMNPWGYASGNPLRYVDPDGRTDFEAVERGMKDGAWNYLAGQVHGAINLGLSLQREHVKRWTGWEVGVLDEGWRYRSADTAVGQDHIWLQEQNMQALREFTQKPAGEIASQLAKQAVLETGNAALRTWENCSASATSVIEEEFSYACGASLPETALLVGDWAVGTHGATGTGRRAVNMVEDAMETAAGMARRGGMTPALAGVPSGHFITDLVTGATDQAGDALRMSRPLLMSADDAVKGGGAPAVSGELNEARAKLIDTLRHRVLGWNHEQKRWSRNETLAISKLEKMLGRRLEPSNIEGIDVFDPNGLGSISVKGPYLNSKGLPPTAAQQRAAVANFFDAMKHNTTKGIVHVVDVTGLSDDMLGHLQAQLGQPGSTAGKVLLIR